MTLLFIVFFKWVAYFFIGMCILAAVCELLGSLVRGILEFTDDLRDRINNYRAR